MHDLFGTGHVDRAIFQPTCLTDFFVNGFDTSEQDGALAELYDIEVPSAVGAPPVHA